jgi:hypothetical protein
VPGSGEDNPPGAVKKCSAEKCIMGECWRGCHWFAVAGTISQRPDNPLCDPQLLFNNSSLLNDLARGEYAWDFKKSPVRVPFRELSTPENERVNALFSMCSAGGDADVVLQRGHYRLNKGTIRGLGPNQQLKGEAIYHFMDGVKREHNANARGGQLPIHFFRASSTENILKAATADADAITACSRLYNKVPGKDIFGLGRVGFVRHLNAHWTGALVDFPTKTVTSFDSTISKGASDDGEALVSAILEYLQREWNAREQRNAGVSTPTPFDSRNWVRNSFVLNKPQLNNFDCGLYVCSLFHHFSLGKLEEQMQTMDLATLQGLRRTLALSIAVSFDPSTADDNNMHNDDDAGIENVWEG